MSIPQFVWATAFNNWAIQSVGPNTYTWPSPIEIGNPFNSTFYGFSTTAPVLINDIGTPANSEVTTPTAVTPNGFTPSALAHSHSDFLAQSGTAGLQEAINGSTGGSAANPALVLLDDLWWAAAAEISTGAAIIAAAKGSTKVMIVDTTTAPWTFYAWNGTAYIVSSALNKSTLAVASQPTFRLSDSELTLGYVGSTTISGSVAAVRGNTTVNSGTTIAGGFVYGTQGKLTVQGTLSDGSGFNCGVLAQLDLSAITGHTSGYLAPLICDVGASVAAGLTTDANLYGIFISNNTTCKMDAGIRMNIKASYLLDLSDSQNDYSWFASSAGASAGKYLVINVGGTTYKIALLANA